MCVSMTSVLSVCIDDQRTECVYRCGQSRSSRREMHEEENLNIFCIVECFQ
jgi:hypothetical protein